MILVKWANVLYIHSQFDHDESFPSVSTYTYTAVSILRFSLSSSNRQHMHHSNVRLQSSLVLQTTCITIVDVDAVCLQSPRRPILGTYVLPE